MQTPDRSWSWLCINSDENNIFKSLYLWQTLVTPEWTFLTKDIKRFLLKNGITNIYQDKIEQTFKDYQYDSE